MGAPLLGPSTREQWWRMKEAMMGRTNVKRQARINAGLELALTIIYCRPSRPVMITVMMMMMMRPGQRATRAGRGNGNGWTCMNNAINQQQQRPATSDQQPTTNDQRPTTNDDDKEQNEEWRPRQKKKDDSISIDDGDGIMVMHMHTTDTT